MILFSCSCWCRHYYYGVHDTQAWTVAKVSRLNWLTSASTAHFFHTFFPFSFKVCKHLLFAPSINTNALNLIEGKPDLCKIIFAISNHWKIKAIPFCRAHATHSPMSSLFQFIHFTINWNERAWYVRNMRDRISHIYYIDNRPIIHSNWLPLKLTKNANKKIAPQWWRLIARMYYNVWNGCARVLKQGKHSHLFVL